MLSILEIIYWQRVKVDTNGLQRRCVLILPRKLKQVGFATLFSAFKIFYRDVRIQCPPISGAVQIVNMIMIRAF